MAQQTQVKKSGRKVIDLDSCLDGDGEWEVDAEGIPKRKKSLGNISNISTYLGSSEFHVDEGTVCVPGQKLAVANEYYEAGEGAHEFGNFVYASIVGHVSLEKFPEQELTIISVKTKEGQDPFIAPTVGAIVTCTVVSRTHNLARCLITHVADGALRTPMRGIIRREYITDKHRDAALIQDSFGQGDMVLARVVGIGDGDFILSTSEDALGVTGARSEAGYKMIPINWGQMECPVTKVKVSRKVAKIVQF